MIGGGRHRCDLGCHSRRNVAEHGFGQEAVERCTDLRGRSLIHLARDGRAGGGGGIGVLPLIGTQWVQQLRQAKAEAPSSEPAPACDITTLARARTSRCGTKRSTRTFAGTAPRTDGSRWLPVVTIACTSRSPIASSAAAHGAVAGRGFRPRREIHDRSAVTDAVDPRRCLEGAAVEALGAHPARPTALGSLAERRRERMKVDRADEVTDGRFREPFGAPDRGDGGECARPRFGREGAAERDGGVRDAARGSHRRRGELGQLVDHDIGPEVVEHAEEVASRIIGAALSPKKSAKNIARRCLGGSAITPGASARTARRVRLRPSHPAEP